MKKNGLTISFMLAIWTLMGSKCRKVKKISSPLRSLWKQLSLGWSNYFSSCIAMMFCLNMIPRILFNKLKRKIKDTKISLELSMQPSGILKSQGRRRWIRLTISLINFYKKQRLRSMSLSAITSILQEWLRQSMRRSRRWIHTFQGKT